MVLIELILDQDLVVLNNRLSVIVYAEPHFVALEHHPFPFTVFFHIPEESALRAQCCAP
jgi:hypothetical protein